MPGASTAADGTASMMQPPRVSPSSVLNAVMTKTVSQKPPTMATTQRPIRPAIRSAPRMAGVLPAGRGVQQLEKVVRGELDLLVPPRRRAVHAGDQAGAMQPPQVPVHEGVPGLRPVLRAVREAEVPRPVLLPRVGLQVRVLGGGVRLDVAPLAVEHVLPCLDQLLRASDRPLVDRIGRHAGALR